MELPKEPSQLGFRNVRPPERREAGGEVLGTERKPIDILLCERDVRFGKILAAREVEDFPIDIDRDYGLGYFSNRLGPIARAARHFQHVSSRELLSQYLPQPGEVRLAFGFVIDALIFAGAPGVVIHQ